MPDGGAVTITSRNEIWDAAALPKGLPRGEYVRLSVADTGEGMDDATLSKAMEPFFTTKGVGKGTGLGLSMVQGLTAQSGGAMHIASEPGKGTSVSLWLPRAQEGEAPKASEAILPLETKIPHRKLRVLVVDDDALVRMGTGDMLMDLGHEVTEASCAARALELLETNRPFDVVFTDYAMPGISGLDLALRIEQINPKLPIVLATGYAELPVRGGQLRFPRLNKPFTQEQLADILQSAANTKSSEVSLS
jgi:CheY-like chemotaxis protein